MKDTRKHWSIMLLAFAIGYVSLSQEIIWFQIYGYYTGGTAEGFSLVLGLFLLGIALGAYFVPKILAKLNNAQIISACLAVSSLVFYFSFPIFGNIATASEQLGSFLTIIFIFLTAFLTGSIFPLLCHEYSELKSSNSSVGTKVSWVYFSNIIGATLGPICTSFVLFDLFSIEKIVFLLSVLSCLLILLVYSINNNCKVSKTFIPCFLILMVSFKFDHFIYKDILEKLHFKSEYTDSYKYLSQTRSGITAVSQNNAIYGGGIYDSVFNTEISSNSNGIDRAYAFSTLHRNPKKILIIGLSSGSWVKVLTMNKRVEEIKVVEINKGYLDLIKNYPDHASILDMDNVKIYFDDGRRWIKRHPDEKFDFILMNTTFHWRAYSANLLSKEFLSMCKNALKPDGVMYFNTTGFEDIFKTGAHVFNHITKYSNFIAVSMAPFNMNELEKEEALNDFIDSDGSPYFKAPHRREAFLNLKHNTFLELGEKYRQIKHLSIITDDNMASEYNSRVAIDPNRQWVQTLTRIFRKKI